MSIRAADALMSIFGFKRVSAEVKWRCEPHDSGYLIVAELIDGTGFAYHLSKEEFKTAHEPDFVFWSAVRAVGRAVRNFQELSNG